MKRLKRLSIFNDLKAVMFLIDHQDHVIYSIPKIIFIDSKLLTIEQYLYHQFALLDGQMVNLPVLVSRLAIQSLCLSDSIIGSATSMEYFISNLAD